LYATCAPDQLRVQLEHDALILRRLAEQELESRDGKIAHGPLGDRHGRGGGEPAGRGDARGGRHACGLGNRDFRDPELTRQAGADAAAAELSGPDRRAIGVAMDVTSEEQVEAGMAKAIKTFGRLDILASNAGIQIVAPLEDFPFAKWKQLLAHHPMKYADDRSPSGHRRSGAADQQQRLPTSDLYDSV
jgi:hypothetical protein